VTVTVQGIGASSFETPPVAFGAGGLLRMRGGLGAVVKHK